MENRETEIRQLTKSFVAEMMSIIGRYRQMEPTDLDNLGAFEKRVQFELDRYEEKFKALRFSYPDCADVIRETEQTVELIASTEVARARSEGRVEYDHLITELYKVQRSMARLVKQLEEKGV